MSKDAKIIMLGQGGHARSLAAVLEACQKKIDAFCVTEKTEGNALLESELLKETPEGLLLVNGVGSVDLPRARQAVFERFKAKGFRFLTLVHPQAHVDPHCELGEGAQIMPGAVIRTGTRIGQNVIVNSGAVVDHDCSIGDHAHIAPGAVLSGEVTVGETCQLGTGCCCIQGVAIGREVLIGAGAVVTKNVADNFRGVGNPLRSLNT